MSERDWTRRDVIATSLAGGAAVMAGCPDAPAAKASWDGEITPSRHVDVLLTVNGVEHP